MGERAELVDIHPLEADEILQKLVAQGRVPSFIRGVVGLKRRPFLTGGYPGSVHVEYEAIPGTQELVYFCFVPPEGTQPGDKFRSEFGVANSVDVVTPTGESRGPAQGYVLTEPQAIRLQHKLAILTQSKPFHT